MKKAIVFLANGFEEMEATGTVDILRRGGIDTKTVSITDDRKVIGAHNMEYTADATFTEIDLSDADALILPGGMPGASNLNNSEPVKEVLLQQYREGRIVAAICAAPMVLGGLGLLKGRKATCYPGFEPKLIGATVTGEAVEVDGNVVTGRGPGLVFNFGLAFHKKNSYTKAITLYQEALNLVNKTLKIDLKQKNLQEKDEQIKKLEDQNNTLLEKLNQERNKAKILEQEN